MSLLTNLPEIRADYSISKISFDARPEAIDRWNPSIKSLSSGSATISIYEQIGEGWDGSGMSSKKMASILRGLADKDITVNINSYGGDFFEGISIYNLLRQHKGKVTVQVLGIAASAASVIAMAGDEILMGDGAWLMIHNAWCVAVGNRYDMAKAAEDLAPFDDAMASLYSVRSGMSKAEIAILMDNESFLSTEQCINNGLATGIMQTTVEQDKNAAVDKKALATVDAALIKAGHSRSERRETLKALFNGMPSAVIEETKPSAGFDADANFELQKLFNNLRGK